MAFLVQKQHWAVYLKKRKIHAGYVEATVFPNFSAQIAYVFSPLFWGQGYAFEACQKIISNLWQNYDLEEIKAEADTRNTASDRLLQKLGFTKVEIRKNVDFFKGSFSDEYIYRLSS